MGIRFRHDKKISIHVLREEDDSKSTQKTCASFAQKVQSFPCRAV